GGTACPQRSRLPPPQLRFSSRRHSIPLRRFSVPNPRSSGTKMRYLAPTRRLKRRPVPSAPRRAAVFLKQSSRPFTCWPRMAAISGQIPTRRSVFNFGAIPPWGWAAAAECSHPVGAPPAASSSSFAAGGLGRHKAHVWPRYGFANRFRVSRIVLTSYDARLDLGRCHQTYGVTERLKFARPIMR